MTAEQIIGLLLALLVMGIGTIGCFVPGIPGTPLVLVAAVGHKLWFGDASTRGWVLAFLVVVTVFSLVLDYAATVMGAKQLGATRRGMFGAAIGAVLGMVVGAFFGGFGSIVGLLAGPFVCAALFELAGDRPWREASRAGVGATVGILAGAAGKVVCSLVMAAVFTVDVLVRQWG